ncbi:MAG: glycosyltransferase family 2 protein [Janthinobacterium lividum]
MTPTLGATGLVSIIIPTYRRPLEVRLAALSALAQTWTEIEVLIISDGPDPETRASVDGLDSRLRYLELPVNGGPAAARNAGVAASRGEWLTFLDDDDSMLPGKVEAEMQLADPLEPRRMVSCRTIYRREDREDVWPKRAIGPDEDLAEYILCRPSLLDRPGVIPIQTLLVHRSIVRQIPFSTHKDHEDWAWLLEAWHVAGARVIFAWQPLVIYNIATESISRSRRMNWEDSLVWVQTYRKWIGDRAFCSFLSTKAALKAKRAGDWKGLCQIASAIFRAHPGFLDLIFLLGVMVLPPTLLQTAWKRSLRSGEGSAATVFKSEFEAG